MTLIEKEAHEALWIINLCKVEPDLEFNKAFIAGYKMGMRAGLRLAAEKATASIMLDNVTYQEYPEVNKESILSLINLQV